MAYSQNPASSTITIILPYPQLLKAYISPVGFMVKNVTLAMFILSRLNISLFFCISLQCLLCSSCSVQYKLASSLSHKLIIRTLSSGINIMSPILSENRGYNAL
jgi:hypothetical protein